jgi:hypothetical protein
MAAWAKPVVCFRRVAARLKPGPFKAVLTAFATDAPNPGIEYACSDAPFVGAPALDALLDLLAGEVLFEGLLG